MTTDELTTAVPTAAAPDRLRRLRSVPPIWLVLDVNALHVRVLALERRQQLRDARARSELDHHALLLRANRFEEPVREEPEGP